jgi:hypothetical protein
MLVPEFHALYTWFFDPIVNSEELKPILLAVKVSKEVARNSLGLSPVET